MTRVANKYFYILLVAVAVGLGIVLPLWFIFAVWEFPFAPGMILYAVTAGAAIASSFLFMLASKHLEYREAPKEA